MVLARPARSVSDARVDDYIRPYREDWLRQIVLGNWRAYGAILIASLIANSLGLAGILFSMQVYDRVIPAESFNTLYVLLVKFTPKPAHGCHPNQNERCVSQ